jgi:hypothetical protein
LPQVQSGADGLALGWQTFSPINGRPTPTVSSEEKDVALAANPLAATLQINSRLFILQQLREDDLFETIM